MLILSRDTADKGKQLEVLTKRILAHRGYRNIVSNRITAGGAEIDLTAEFPFTLPNGQEKCVPLICECKAHQSPQAITPWLKFLGKVYHEETERNEEVHGCFISLSGVNGNVAGSFASYSKIKSNITLLSQSDIENSARQIHTLCSADTRDGAVRSLTQRPIRSFEIAYFEEKLYWVAFFEDATFAVLDGNGENLQPDKEDDIGNLVRSTSGGQLVRLLEEQEIIRRTILLQKNMIVWFANWNGGVPISSSEQNGEIQMLGQDTSIPHLPNDFNRIVKSLEAENWVTYDTAKQRLGFRENDKGLCPDFPTLVDFILTPPADASHIQNFVNSEFYARHINEYLVDSILQVQGNLQLSDAHRKQLTDLLRLTPSGLRMCLQPIEMIVNHRHIGETISESTNEADCATLFQYVYDGLLHDFNHPVFAGFFFKTHGIVEVERQQSIVIKTPKAVIHEGEINARIRIGKLTDEFGGGLIHVALVPNAPQPWDVNNQEKHETSA